MSVVCWGSQLYIWGCVSVVKASALWPDGMLFCWFMLVAMFIFCSGAAGWRLQSWSFTKFMFSLEKRCRWRFRRLEPDHQLRPESTNNLKYKHSKFRLCRFFSVSIEEPDKLEKHRHTCFSVMQQCLENTSVVALRSALFNAASCSEVLGHFLRSKCHALSLHHLANHFTVSSSFTHLAKGPWRFVSLHLSAEVSAQVDVAVSSGSASQPQKTVSNRELKMLECKYV